MEYIIGGFAVKCTVYYYRSGSNLPVNFVIMMENARYQCKKSKQYITSEEIVAEVCWFVRRCRLLAIVLKIVECIIPKWGDFFAFVLKIDESTDFAMKIEKSPYHRMKVVYGVADKSSKIKIDGFHASLFSSQFYMQDVVHLIVKLKTRLFKISVTLPIGNFIISASHLKEPRTTHVHELSARQHRHPVTPTRSLT